VAARAQAHHPEVCRQRLVPFHHVRAPDPPRTLGALAPHAALPAQLYLYLFPVHAHARAARRCRGRDADEGGGPPYIWLQPGTYDISVTISSQHRFAETRSVFVPTEERLLVLLLDLPESSVCASPGSGSAARCLRPRLSCRPEQPASPYT
jgi:hypothetical protein